MLVGAGDGAGQGLDQRGGRPGRLRPALAGPGQRGAADQLHGEVGAAVALADVVDLDDIGVVQPGHGLGFGAEAGPVDGAGAGPGVDHLQGDQPIQADLPRR